MTKSLAACLFAAGTLFQVAAATPTFEVATIKVHKPEPGPLRVSAAVETGGIRFTNVTLRSCIRQAYELRMLGGPAWLNDDRFDIIAKAAGPATREQLMQMLQQLLADRFHLVVHVENREMPVYFLVAGNKGPKIHAVKDDGRGMEIGGPAEHGTSFRNVTMAALAANLARLREIDRPVLDRTGLEGIFTFTLDLSSDDNGPSIFTALQEELGLKLEATRGRVEVLVIDRAEKPSEN